MTLVSLIFMEAIAVPFFLRPSRLFAPLSLILGFSILPSADAVTQYEPKSTYFVTDPLQFRQSLMLPVVDSVEEVRIPGYKLRKRTFQAAKDERVEPLTLDLPKSESKLAELSERMARRGKQQQLLELITSRLRQQPASELNSTRITVDPELFKLVTTKALADDYAKPHHRVELKTNRGGAAPEAWTALLEQMQPFLSRTELQSASAKISAEQPLSLELDLLPNFARRMVRKFLVYRGPNCFHATLAFHGQALTRSPFVNVKEEKGYHAAMINYDELWRVLYTLFYEVDTRQAPLKYGDILVFMNTSDQEPMNYRWIRHTAVYLFGAYTFSKGSKSPNTPYTIKTLDEEWKTWRGYTQNLGVKVFRRSASNPVGALPNDLSDWVY